MLYGFVACRQEVYNGWMPFIIINSSSIMIQAGIKLKNSKNQASKQTKYKMRERAAEGERENVKSESSGVSKLARVFPAEQRKAKWNHIK